MLKQFLNLIVVGLFFTLAGCAVEDATSTNSTGGTGIGATPVPTGSGAATSENFEVTVVENVNYTVIASKDGDGTTPCEVTASGQDILCVIDINELDLWHRGYQFNYTLPYSACRYSEFSPYFYSVAPVGDMPIAVSYEVNADGDIIAADPNDASGIATNSFATNDINFYFGGGVWRTQQELTGVRAATPAQLRCPWDYTEVFANGAGKNCCRGDYTAYSISDGDLQDPSDETWGGQEGNCFYGPGIQNSTVSKDEDTGIPIPEIVNVDTEGYSNIFTVNSHYRASLNVMGANYYKLADHTALSGITYLGDMAGESYAIPNATQIASYWSGFVASNYTIDCLDEAYEVNSRIRVLVREWNQVSEFENFVAGLSTAPDTVGTETTPDQSSSDALVSVSNPDGPNNDFKDWYDCDNGSSCGYNGDYSDFILATAANALILPRSIPNYIGFSRYVED